MKLQCMVCRLLIVALTLVGNAALGWAQFMPNAAATDGISVYGTGEVSARPNLVEIDLHVSGKAELTGDALVKYRDAKKRVIEALEKLKVKNMTTEEYGLSITVGNSLEQQQRFNNGMPQTPGKPQVDVSSTVRAKLTAVRDVPAEDLIKTVGKLMDVAQDSGVSVGPNPAEVMRAMRYNQAVSNASPVRFVLADLAELREKAYEKAVADARSRATRLAKLHHVTLGSALSIQEILVGGDQITVNGAQFNQANPSDDEEGLPRIASTTLAPVPVQVKLLVRFAITPADPATAQQ